MNRLGKRILVIISCLVLVIGSASAAPPFRDHPGKGQQMKHHGGPKFTGGGPPPWAPAHGYRRNQYREYGLSAMPISIDSGHCNREVIGQILGGVAGGYVGAEISEDSDATGRLVAVAAGSVVGMVLGGEIGRSLDRADELCVDQALEHAPDGSRITWNDERRRYSVTPRETFESTGGRYCREYTMEVGVNGRTGQVYGTACRQPDGTWQMVSDS